MLVHCELCYQSAYQGFDNVNVATLITFSSNFCLARQSWENVRTNHVVIFFYFCLHSLSKHPPVELSCPLCVHGGHFVIVEKSPWKLHPNKEIDWQVELDWDWKVSAWRELKQNLDVLVHLYYCMLFANFVEGSLRITLNLHLAFACYM